MYISYIHDISKEPISPGLAKAERPQEVYVLGQDAHVPARAEVDFAKRIWNLKTGPLETTGLSNGHLFRADSAERGDPSKQAIQEMKHDIPTEYAGNAFRPRLRQGTPLRC